MLRGATYPHGLRFAADDRRLLVADAGAPYVHVFAADGSWQGASYPASTIRVMDDETFERARHNPQEGGPKGIDLDPRTKLLIVTSESTPWPSSTSREPSTIRGTRAETRRRSFAASCMPSPCATR